MIDLPLSMNAMGNVNVNHAMQLTSEWGQINFAWDPIIVFFRKRNIKSYWSPCLTNSTIWALRLPMTQISLGIRPV